MRKQFFLSLLILTLAGCGASMQNNSEDNTNIVAEFSDVKITRAEFNARYTRSTGDETRVATDSLAQLEEFLDRYVDFKLKVHAARQAGLDKDSTLTAELAQYRQQLARPFMMEQEVLEGIVKELYDRQQEEVNASHILIFTKPEDAPEDTLKALAKIQVVLDSLNAGADFDSLAFALSEDPSAKRNNGNLGFFKGGNMIHSFENRAYTIETGNYSEIFRTRFGYHILKVNARRPAKRDIQASHILIKSQAADTSEAFATITDIYNRISAGESFADLAREFSQDPGSARKGGDLGFFSTSQNFVEPFKTIAFEIENIGDVSRVFRTQFGYHIIKLTGRKDAATYEESYEELKRLAKNLPRVSARENELAAQIRNENGSTLDSTLIEMTLSKFAPTETWMALQVDSLAGGLNDSTVLNIGTSNWTMSDLAVFATQTRRFGAVADRATMYKVVEAFQQEKSIEFGANQLEERNDEFRQLMQEYADGILLFKISEDSVWNAASVDSTRMSNWYNDHAAKYNYDERIKVTSYFTGSDSVIARVDSMLTAGFTADQIGDVFVVGLQLDTTFISDSTNSIYDRVFDLKESENTGVMPYRRGHIILVHSGVDAPHAKTFDEARAEVISDLQTVIEDEWKSRLRRRYTARLYPEHLILEAEPSETN